MATNSQGPGLGQIGVVQHLPFFEPKIIGRHQAGEEGNKNCQRGGRGQAVSPDRFLKTIQVARRAGHDRLAIQMTFNISGQAVGRLVTPRPIFLQGFEDNPIQIAANQVDSFLHP